MGKPWEIIQGDVRRVCKMLDSNSFDACLCDPPYELSNDGQASAAGVALEFMFPKYPQFESHFFGRDQLALLIGEVLELGRGGSVPGPAPAVPVGPVTLDDDAALRDDDVEDAGEGAISAAEWKARQHHEAKGTKHLGDFALKLADTGTMLETLNRVGTCFYSGGLGVGPRLGESAHTSDPGLDDGMGVWVGAHVRATSLPSLLHGRAPIDLGDAVVRACDDPLAGPVGARRGAEGEPVADPLSLRRCDEDLLSACAALTLFGALQLGGAQLVRARSGAGRFPAKLQSRRIRVVDTRTHRALTFNLLLHPMDVSSTGFMGKSWDGGKVAYDVALWQQVLRVLKPGAPLLAFGGTRTYHRMVVAIEDAGFEIRDQLAWMYGSGFPKSLDVSKAIDKAAGAVREAVGQAHRKATGRMAQGEGGFAFAEDYALTAPATPLAQQWQGYGTALKPAHEPIVLARKPLDGTVAENVARWGVGGLAIDACRIGNELMEKTRSTGEVIGRSPSMAAPLTRSEHVGYVEGRWPSNITLDDRAAALLDAQSSGGISRFFYTAKADTYQRNAGLESVPKRTRAQNTDRKEGSAGSQHARVGVGSKDGTSNHHPTLKPIDLIRYFARLILPPPRSTPRRILVPFSGSGSEIIGCLQAGWDEVVGIEREVEYVEIARQRITNGGVLSALADRKMRKRKKKRAP